MERIKDVLFIKDLERQIGRRLSDEELETEDREGEVRLIFADGVARFVAIPRLVFPDELMDDVPYFEGPAKKLVYISDDYSWKMRKNVDKQQSVWDVA